MESSCFPIFPLAFKIRAANPSKKSIRAPKNIQSDAVAKFPSKAKMIANRPQVKFPIVIKLGIFVLIAFIISKNMIIFVNS